MTDTTDLSPKPAGHLLRVLGLAFGIAVSVGGTIGVGIFRTPGGVAHGAGVWWMVLMLWVLGGVHALLGTNVVGELAAAVPRAGGPYAFAHRALGPFGGLVVGWSDWLQNTSSLPSLAIPFAEFTGEIFPAVAPYKTHMAVIFLAILFAANWVGVRNGSAIQKTTTGLKGLLLVAFVAAVFILLPPAPASHHGLFSFGGAASWLALFGAYQLVVYAFAGWNSPSYFSEENADPGKSLPKALAIGALLVAGIYILINIALLYALPFDHLAASKSPGTEVMNMLGGPWGMVALAVVAMVSIISCTNAGIMQCSRILYSLSVDRLFPRAATHVNRGGSPDVGMGVTAVVALVMTITGTFEMAAQWVALLSAVVYLLTDLALFILRWREPDLPRPFKAIGYPWLPLLVLIVDAVMVVAFIFANPKSGLYGMGMLAICVPLFFFMKWVNRTPVVGA